MVVVGQKVLEVSGLFFVNRRTSSTFGYGFIGPCRLAAGPAGGLSIDDDDDIHLTAVDTTTRMVVVWWTQKKFWKIYRHGNKSRRCSSTDQRRRERLLQTKNEKKSKQIYGGMDVDVLDTEGFVTARRARGPSSSVPIRYPNNKPSTFSKIQFKDAIHR